MPILILYSALWHFIHYSMGLSVCLFFNAVLLYRIHIQNDSFWNNGLLLLSCFSHVWLCYPIDCSPPGSSVPGILQARILEWVVISFSNALKWKVKVKSLSHVQLFTTPWTVAYKVPPSVGFSRQEYWSGLPFPSPVHDWLLLIKNTH